MVVSYKWLQEYFDSSLPSPKELEEILTMKVFEIEGVEEKNGDSVIDIKVLPDRAHYALCHRGIAGEIGAATGLTLKERGSKTISVDSSVSKPEISVEDTDRCPRYMGRLVENISVTASPEWLREKIIILGQQSINSVVDAANYVMFDMGQPLHAFDADKVVGDITVRRARDGERITTLDGKDVALNPEVLVIADNEGPLAIAGIKGGTRGAVTLDTKRIIIEAANFHAGSIRKTSTTLGIRTDASKRFENAITPKYTSIAIEEITALISSLSESSRVGEVVDIYPNPVTKTVLSVDLQSINKTLGIEVPRENVIQILESIGVEVEDMDGSLGLTIPFERLDLTIPEDIAEEVGRLYGYDKLLDVLPPQNVTPEVNKMHYYKERVRDILVEQGFSEVYLYTLVNEGELEVALPLAEDKKMLRTNLISGMKRSLIENGRNAPLFGLDHIKLFEFGGVFTKEKEEVYFALGVENAPGFKKIKAQDALTEVKNQLLAVLGVREENISSLKIEENVLEFSFTELVELLSDPSTPSLEYDTPQDLKYAKFSTYPFVLRDVAVWVPNSVTEEELAEIIRGEAGELLVTMKLFDRYEKEGRVSYAFRLVFQSGEKTLTDEEVNTYMDRVYGALTERGFETR